MKQGKWICLIILALMPIVPIFSADTKLLEQGIIDKVYQCYSLEKNQVEIEILKIRFNSDDLIYDSLTVMPLTQGEPKGQRPVNILLYRDNKLIKEGQVRINIRYFGNVLVTSDKIARNSLINPGLLVEERRDITFLSEKALTRTDDLAGRRARRNINKNQILTSGMLEKIPDVSSGDKVYIVYETTAITISASGIAMENGYRGDQIRVKNNQSNKIIACTILDDKTVQASSH